MKKISECIPKAFLKDDALKCDNCGVRGAFAFDGKTLCEDCYYLQGSCCPEFGGNDFWADTKSR